MTIRRRAAPPPRSVFRLPDAVERAELLIGSVVRSGPGVRPIGWPDSPRIRAHIAGNRPPAPRLILALGTAAWVWGASWEPNQVVEWSTLESRRLTMVDYSGCRVHEFNIRRDEVEEFDGIFVTSPLRTLWDMLLHSDPFNEPEQAQCAALLGVSTHIRSALQERLTNDHVPYVKRATHRFETVTARKARDEHGL